MVSMPVFRLDIDIVLLGLRGIGGVAGELLDSYSAISLHRGDYHPRFVYWTSFYCCSYSCSTTFYILVVEENGQNAGVQWSLRFISNKSPEGRSKVLVLELELELLTRDVGLV
jgi:hypothetical protein